MENSSNDKGLGLPATPSGSPLQVLAEDGSGLSASIPKPPAHMSAEEYKERRRVLDEYVDKYVNMRRGLDKQWCALAPFQVGDLVRVKHGGRVTEAFISSVEIGYTPTVEPYRYKFNKRKKDGSQSASPAGIYWIDEIELIAKATSNP